MSLGLVSVAGIIVLDAEQERTRTNGTLVAVLHLLLTISNHKDLKKIVAATSRPRLTQVSVLPKSSPQPYKEIGSGKRSSYLAQLTQYKPTTDRPLNFVN